MPLPIPGKNCGPCNMCCKVLDIPELAKPPGPLCPSCVAAKGCSIYHSRPQVCRDFECEWLMERALGPKLRPDLTGVILMEDADGDEYRAVCDPARPMEWLKPLVFKHLLTKAKEGRTVVAKAGMKSWQIHENGQWNQTV